jgi:uncharacterized protein
MATQETIRARGHPLVLGTHPTTFEVTREDHLTANGNCIIGIAADKGCADLSSEFKATLAHDDAVLITRFTCEGASVEVRSYGSSQMMLNHPTDMVWRKSTFVCGRTIGIHSDATALTLPRDLIRNLVSGKEMVVSLTVTRPGSES